MGKTKKSVDVSALPDVDVQRRLSKLIIKNFRCIGNLPVEIDLNDIVVLVGPNNVGKSSILKAYEVAMSDGSKESELKIDDFPNGEIGPNFPEIELHTIVDSEGVGAQWVQKTSEGELLVRERWIWQKEGKPKREGWDVTTNKWNTESFPFGPANIANQKRPQPHRVGAFDKPEVQAEAIKDLLMAAIKDKIKNLQSSNPDNGKNEYHQLIDKVKDLQKKIVSEAQTQIDTANAELTKLIEKVFPNYKIDFDAKPEDDLDKSITFFKANSELLMGPEGGYLSTIEKQGSGARRTLLWTALKYISENNQKIKEDGTVIRPHLLLIDEPEICLHPSAIREACNVLYELPTSGNWQVMVTTHSPIFVDFSRNNTTIIRVEKNGDGHIQGTTVFRPDKAKLDDDDIKNLKFLNLCDPYMAEFLFGGKVIIVEGDTEYTAFNYIKSEKPEEFKNVHIIRARGKAPIVSLVKILNHFGSSYSILHDSDTPTIINKKKKEQGNPAWGNNPTILQSVLSRPANSNCRLLASLPNFEKAYFGEEAEDEKPYNALRTLMEDPVKFQIVETLFKALIDHSAPLPLNCAEWATIDELKSKLDVVLKKTE